ncbi:MAG: gluconate 2-dehydrogenase subunit 3 family protein [Pseudonocardia sp.]
MNAATNSPELGLVGTPDDVRDMLRAAAAEPGGNRVPVTFSKHQTAVLRAIVDELVPPGDGFPAPSEVGVVEDFVPRYVAPRGSRTKPFPGAVEDAFTAALDAVDQQILSADRAQRVAVLRKLEESDPEFFGQLRALTYAGYYSRPAVVSVMRVNLRAARDYNGPPLPYGYDRVTPDWDGFTLPEDGRFTATDDVAPPATGTR